MLNEIISELEGELTDQLGSPDALEVAENIEGMNDEDDISDDEQALLEEFDSLDEDEQELFVGILEGIESGDLGEEEISELIGILDEDEDDEDADSESEYNDRGRDDEDDDDEEVSSLDEFED